ncbi:hypothetical protein R70723_16685 [Paenibacillus sp. FSL R7-0273]|uniref:DinB family protein n=1 Tax=Paenibacillus sp. FSL R7-0273 TaxID=1536772 RepID=UPI0004F6B520|nr:DinB family protein [Paenibacillus sp. FSL R7-0273]AIQ47342.1 hypothetical protein R70723_16685 [Paenibacillus sp. FSL R7-0273]OMF96105.1 hypothetical protein BK144_05895 [Paenibacillus sp. FSL R7-0273]
MSDRMVAVLRRQFEPSLEMLQQLVDAGPDALWLDAKQKYWKHIFHTATSMKFWFRLQKEEEFIIPDFGRDITEALDEDCTDYPTKEEMKTYIQEIAGIARTFLDQLTDDNVMEPCVLFAEITNMDVVLMQIRHVQHHVGYCNSILNSNSLKAVEWV